MGVVETEDERIKKALKEALKDNDTSEVVCKGCGNNQDRCHDFLFGETLYHEAITFYQEREPNKIKMKDLEYEICSMYNSLLRHYCVKEFEMYDKKGWYELPRCIKKGNLKSALKLIGNLQFYQNIKKNKRRYGVAHECMFANYNFYLDSDEE